MVVVARGVSGVNSQNRMSSAGRSKSNFSAADGSLRFSLCLCFDGDDVLRNSCGCRRKPLSFIKTYGHISKRHKKARQVSDLPTFINILLEGGTYTLLPPSLLGRFLGNGEWRE